MGDTEQRARDTRSQDAPAAGGRDDPELTDGGASDSTAATPPSASAPSRLPRTRTSVTFQALIAGVVVLVLLLIFILENTESVRINYLGAKGNLSLGIALLLAAAGGALLVAIVGAARIGQLRLHERRQRRR